MFRNSELDHFREYECSTSKRAGRNKQYAQEVSHAVKDISS